jgi:hypothetical protein
MVFVSGSSEGGPTGNDYATLAYDSNTGSTLWVTRSNIAGLDDDADSMAVSPDGSKIFVTGDAWVGNGATDYATVAYDTVTGAALWKRQYSGPLAFGQDHAYAIAASPDGSDVFVTGTSYGTVGACDYATVAYATDSGATLWERRYNGPGNGCDAARSLVVSADGSRVFLTGESTASSFEYGYATFALDAATGDRIWLARFDSPLGGDDMATALALSPDGAFVYVTGSTSTSNGFDYGTVAYDAATGALLGLNLYNGAANGNDEPIAAAVSPDGSELFVTGSSEGPSGSDWDYATIAYRA